jgi:hypothetical protein
LSSCTPHHEFPTASSFNEDETKESKHEVRDRVTRCEEAGEVVRKADRVLKNEWEAERYLNINQVKD